MQIAYLNGLLAVGRKTASLLYFAISGVYFYFEKTINGKWMFELRTSMSDWTVMVVDDWRLKITFALNWHILCVSLLLSLSILKSPFLLTSDKISRQSDVHYPLLRVTFLQISETLALEFLEGMPHWYYMHSD